MKKILMIALLSAALSGNVSAKEVSYTDIISDPGKYVGKSVVMKGSFLYSEPMRESFTFDQGGNSIEVFYSSLSRNAKEFLLSQQKYSKAELTVSGTLQKYTNSGLYFIQASSLRFESGAAPAPSDANFVTYDDILADPFKYLNRKVTLRGSFLYSEPMRQSFTLDQNGNSVEVLLSDLSKMDRDLILSQKKYSKSPVTVTGLLQAYANKTKTYFINAYSVAIEN